jgi:hypothetical protein
MFALHLNCYFNRIYVLQGRHLGGVGCAIAHPGFFSFSIIGYWPRRN